jgi:RimJ/RimL family protein N-acetyltransferase
MVARAATDVVRVLVSFGSCLPQGLVESVLRALSCNGLDDLYVDVVVSSGTEVNGELRKIARRRDRCTVHSALPSLAGLKLRSDIALGAGGVSMLERASLGLPSVVAITAENQRQPAEAMAARGAILLLGLSESVVDQDWASAVLSLRDDASRRLKMAQAAAALVDCWGTHRVAAAMLGIGTNSIILREATAGDETLLLDWANDPVVRCNSFNEEAISPEVHRNWFGRQLADPRSAIFVAIGPAGLPVGQIRVETDESESFARIHISVDPALRGKGVGRLMLAAIVERARRRPTLARLFAEVRNGNHASRRIFLASGFREIPTANLDRITFELNL